VRHLSIRTRVMLLPASAILLMAAASCTHPARVVRAPVLCMTASPDERALARYASDWTDTSPHREGFVVVRGARLEYLEWGPLNARRAATGRPTMVLLAGSGQTAHIFDDFAPSFMDRFRVIAVTRRGTSPSSAPDSGYAVADLASDVVVVMDSLHVSRASLVGHSIAGGEITRIAADHPDRVDGLVYLDATYNYADHRTQSANPVPRPAMGSGDTTMAAGRRWLARDFYGFWSNGLEADLRAMRDKNGMDEELHDQAVHPAPYGGVRAPALIFLARPTLASAYPWLTSPGDSAKVRAAQQYLVDVRLPQFRENVERMRRALPTAAVIEIDSPHHVFIARRSDVVKATREFLVGP
jgi:non-heme chloroperoxidase